MPHSKPKGQYWRVGELAEAVGVSVRTLHHYEALGLLSAIRRTEGDHRLYDAACVERLYRIRTLRDLGFSLSEIRRWLDDGTPLRDLLTVHLARVESDIAKLTTLRDRLRGLSTAGPEVPPDELIATLEAMAHLERQAHARRKRGTSTSAESRWRALGEKLRTCMNRGDSPSSARAKAAALEARALLHEFAEGDPAVLKALAKVRAVAPPDGLAGWDPELTRYLDRALAALK